MLNGVYQNAAAMKGLESWNNSIAQNLSQSSTPGYKKATVSFQGQDGGSVGYDGPFDQTLQRATVTASSAGGIDYTDGNVTITHDPYELALEGKGFFELKMPSGDFVYTRDGQFKVNNDGELVSKQGYHVMSDGRSPINFMLDGGAPTIEKDGTVRQNGQKIGQIGVRDVEDYSVFNRSHGGFVIASESEVEAMHSQTPVRQGALERSNVSVTNEMVNLINVSRSYQINQKVISNHDEIMGKAIRSLGGNG